MAQAFEDTLTISSLHGENAFFSYPAREFQKMDSAEASLLVGPTRSDAMSSTLS